MRERKGRKLVVLESITSPEKKDGHENNSGVPKGKRVAIARKKQKKLLEEVDTLVRSLTFEDCTDEGVSKRPLRRVSDILEEGPKCHSIEVETPIIAAVAPEVLDVTSAVPEEVHDGAVEAILELGGVEETCGSLLPGRGLGCVGGKVASSFPLEDLEV